MAGMGICGGTKRFVLKPEIIPDTDHYHYIRYLQEAMMAPKVLISDKLSEKAISIFKDRGIDVDYLPDLGKDKDKLRDMIAG